MDMSKICFGLLFALVINSPLRAQELKIIDVRRNIPLRDDEPAYKDFYINGGTKEGLKPNLVVTAVRKTTIRDAAGLQALGEMNVPVGQLRIIFVQDGLAVAREHQLLSRDELPMIEQIGIMGGDLVEMKGSFIEKRKPNALPSPVPAPTAAAAPMPATPTANTTPVGMVSLPIPPPTPEKTESEASKTLDYSARAL